MNEHEFEPVRGLPGPLPPGETVLWQGSPRPAALARRLFHLVPLAIYFAVLAAWSGILAASSAPDAPVAVAVGGPVAMGLVAIVLLAALAALMARTTVYTVTSRRLVLRIGVVLSITFNIPFGVVASAGLRRYRDGTGDLPITLAGSDRIAYLHLWPHARPWRFARPEPMLRCVPDADRVASILAEAILASQGAAVRAAAPADPKDLSPAAAPPLATAR